jgi:uncharacterized membrane protein
MMHAMDEHVVQDTRPLSTAIYGTILVLAVIAALSHDPGLGPGEVLAGMLGSSLVYWMAHLYADVLGRRAAGVVEPLPAMVAEAATVEWPLVEAALLPAIPLVLGMLGILDRGPAVTLAVIVALADLLVWGYVAGRRSGLARVAALAGGLGAVALGTVMVLLKNALK